MKLKLIEVVGGWEANRVIKVQPVISTAHADYISIFESGISNVSPKPFKYATTFDIFRIGTGTTWQIRFKFPEGSSYPPEYIDFSVSELQQSDRFQFQFIDVLIKNEAEPTAEPPVFMISWRDARVWYL